MSQALTEEHLQYQQEGPVAYITFNRPEARNAMTFGMYDGLCGLCEQIDLDEGVRVVVLRGGGNRSFVSGTDIKQFLTFETAEHALQYEARVSRAVSRVEALKKPSIASIQGDAVGGGLFLALACDVRIATQSSRFGAPIARTLGNFPSPTNLTRLVAAIGLFRARSMVLTARLAGAAEALQVGLIDEMVPAESLANRTAELAAHIATLAPLTLRATKEATRRILNSAPLEAEDLLLSCYLSADFKEGVRAFLEKRTPNWQGR